MLAFAVRTSVRRPGVVAALAALLLGYGGYRLATVGLDIFPEFSPRLVIVQTEAPGYTAEQVERLVSLPVEAALGGLIGLRSVRSQSIPGLSVVEAVFEDSVGRRAARQAVGERLAALAQAMPPRVAAPAMVPFSSSSATVMTIGLTSATRSPTALRDLADRAVAPRLLRAPGVVDINVFGGAGTQWQVQADPAALRRHGVSLDALAAAAADTVDARGAGFLDTPTQRLALSSGGQALDPRAVANAVLRSRGDRPLVIADVAAVVPGAAPPIGQAAIVGEPGVVMMIIGQFGADTLAVSREIDAALAELAPTFERHGVVLHDDLFRPAGYIQRSFAGLLKHLAVGSALVVAVLAAFLFNGRAAFISVAAIPLSLIAAALVLIEAGANLNVMVLGGLAIALGEVVDDAIIDTENALRRLRENRALPAPRPVRDVVFDASMEVRGSMVHASLIVALAFVPLLSLSGVAGRMFFPVGATYILAIGASLAVALTVTPALCVLLLRGGRAGEGPPPLVRRLQPAYGRLLRAVARRDRLAMAATAAAVAASLAALPLLQSRFLPELREGHYMIHTSGVPGMALDENIRLGTRLTERVMAIPGVRKMSQWAGRAERGADTYGSHYAEYEVDLEPLPGPEQQRVLDSIRGLLDRFPGLATEVNTFLVERVEETITGYGGAVAVQLFGGSLDLLERKAGEAAAVMRSLPGAVDVRVRATHAVPALAVEVDDERMAFHGVRPRAVYDAMNIAFEGRVVGEVHEGGRAVPLAVTVAPDARALPERVAALPVAARGGGVVALGDVASVTADSRRYAILREGGQRVRTVTGNLTGVDADRFVSWLEERLRASLDLPAGVHFEIAGAAVEAGAARGELILRALLVGAGVLILLHIALGHVANVALVATNLPFSLAGGVLAALWTGGVLSLGSFVGFVTLFGITLRNAIMLVSHYRHLVVAEGLPWSPETAVRGAEERLPSILMTALATALAMLPIAIASDNPGHEIIGPMAGVIVGGMATSTVLNLLVLPAVMSRYGRFPRGPAAAPDAV